MYPGPGYVLTDAVYLQCIMSCPMSTIPLLLHPSSDAQTDNLPMTIANQTVCVAY